MVPNCESCFASKNLSDSYGFKVPTTRSLPSSAGICYTVFEKVAQETASRANTESMGRPLDHCCWSGQWKTLLQPFHRCCGDNRCPYILLHPVLIVADSAYLSMFLPQPLQKSWDVAFSIDDHPSSPPSTAMPEIKGLMVLFLASLHWATTFW